MMVGKALKSFTRDFHIGLARVQSIKGQSTIVFSISSYVSDFKYVKSTQDPATPFLFIAGLVSYPSNPFIRLSE